MLRALILEHGLPPSLATAFLSRDGNTGETGPRAEAVKALRAMGVGVRLWERGAETLIGEADLIIDGIAGTGLSGPLRDIPLAMVQALNSLAGPLVAAIDVPSGNFDAWKGGMPIAEADYTLAIEPLKASLFKPLARRFGGNLIPVGGIFPGELIKKYGHDSIELLSWEVAQKRIPPAPPDAHKYVRGVAEIRAGAPGSSGAPWIAGKGAQAAGAGIVRLLTDRELYPILAASAGGIMVGEAGSAADDPERFRPDAVLLGPGWGKSAGRKTVLEGVLERCRPCGEGEGTPLILDADAIALARGMALHRNVILTPHPGEFAAFTGIPREETLADPAPVLRRVARELGVTIMYKGAVIYIADPLGRVGVVDGMNPLLAAGGSGDLLAGLCTGIAARMRAMALRGGGADFDGYTCAAAGAALFMAAGKSIEASFVDPLELVPPAAALAGKAWL
jgi:NAD(P)H-hydrate epimerase